MFKNKAYRLILLTIWLQVVIAIIFLGASIGISMLSVRRAPEERDSILLKEPGQAVIDHYVSSLFTPNVTDVAVKSHFYDYPSDSEVYEKDHNYYIISPDNKKKPIKINSEFPFITKDGQVLLLYHNAFELITEEGEVLPSQAGTYLNQSKLYNQAGECISEEMIILLRLPNGLYMNTSELIFESSNDKQILEGLSVLSFQQPEIAYCNIRESRPKLKRLTLIDEMTTLLLGDNHYSYDSFYRRLNQTEPEAQAMLRPIIVEEDIYQYFLGNRYDYKGIKEIFYSSKGYYCKLGEKRFFLPKTPLYFAGENRLMLPCDYVAVQPRLYLMNKLPALAQLTYAEGITYTKIGAVPGTYTNMFVFDGEDIYLFLDEALITMGEDSITLPPFSYVIATEEGNLECYNYDTGEYLSYYVERRNIIQAEVAGEIKLNLSNDTLYRVDGQEQILFSEPSLLTNLR